MRDFIYQGKPIIICGESDVELQKKSQYVLKLPEVVDCLQVILTVIPLQLLSFHIAVLRGYDVSINIFFFKLITLFLNRWIVHGI